MARINAKEDAKKKIIAAALDIAAEHGWDAVTLDAIAQNIGVTKPALYSYFENREALLRDVLFEVFRNIRSELETTLADDDDIHHIIRNLAELLFEKQKFYANLFFQLPFRLIQDPRNREEFAIIFDKSRSVIRDCLARAKSREKLPRDVDPDEAACIIIAMTMGLQFGSPSMGMDVNAEKKIWIRTVERFLLIGLK